MKGKLFIIGIGPGNIENMTIRAYNTIKSCHVLAGYTVYVEQIKDLSEGKEIITKGMGQEIERCKLAIKACTEGKQVGLVCSGDSGLYGMAGLALEIMNKMSLEERPEVEIIPGVTAALSSSSLLGAPIVEDFCTISLSDYMTPLSKIMNRIEKASEADFTIALYNPRSSVRQDYLKEALAIISKYRSLETPVGIVRNAYRADEKVQITTLEKLDADLVDMFCTLIIGNSKTSVIGDFMVTSRGYRI